MNGACTRGPDSSHALPLSARQTSVQKSNEIEALLKGLWSLNTSGQEDLCRTEQTPAPAPDSSLQEVLTRKQALNLPFPWLAGYSTSKLLVTLRKGTESSWHLVASLVSEIHAQHRVQLPLKDSVTLVVFAKGKKLGLVAKACM